MTKQYRRQAEKLKHPFQLRQINVFYTSHREFSRYRLEVKLSEQILMIFPNQNVNATKETPIRFTLWWKYANSF